ncbi:MAG: hypothetical protein ACYSRZ_06600 [Planctomycetota bacterium]|jgi:hypothetical protein
MRLRDIIICFLCFILTVGLLIAAGLQLDYINYQRKEMKLIINEPLENAPPSLAFATVAMGAFRGLVVDILWLRADKLKEQGQFFDAKQLAEWISILQPRFAAVWEFHAWNMAYNISAAIPETEPEQRWKWVKNGCELLRDQGIVRNPKSILLYRELARFFQHKIGSVSDNAHRYYKLQLAKAMAPLLGPADQQYFDALEKAPADWAQISNDANFTPLIDALKAADETFIDEESFVSNYLSLRQNPARFAPQAFEVINRFRATELLKKFDIFARAYHLRNSWKLDPVLMNQLNHKYGPIDWTDPNRNLPLDWRHPDSHAIYWAVKGLQVAGKKEYRSEETNTDRIVGHSLQNLFRNGTIYIYDPPAKTDSTSDAYEPEIFLRPDLRMFIPYNNALKKVIDKYEQYAEQAPGSLESLKIGHRNMLKNAVLSFYQAGHIPQAQGIYERLRKLYPRDEFKVPLVIYVKNRFREEVATLDMIDVKEMVQMILRESYFRYALRDDDEAYNSEKFAKEIYDYYQTSHSDENRINLPDFKLIRYFALIDFFNDRQYPPVLRSSLLRRIEIERPALAEQLKQQEKKVIEQSQQSN